MSRIDTEKHIDMTSVGCLVAVNIDRHKGCQHHPNTVECIFDTGITVYAPMALFDTMMFRLAEADPPKPKRGR